jgi:hypothetical protein
LEKPVLYGLIGKEFTSKSSFKAKQPSCSAAFKLPKLIKRRGSLPPLFLIWLVQ